MAARQTYVSTVLIGASKPHPLEDNLGAVNPHLTADEVYALNDLTRRQEVYPAWFTRDIGPNGVVDYALTDATAATWPEAPPSSWGRPMSTVRRTHCG